jgi:FKBP-type peptidyl-prolyl cis-trans isomerase FkpA
MSEATKVAIRPIQKGSLTRMWVGLAFAGLVAGGIAWAGMQRTAAFRGNAEQFLAWNEGNAGVEKSKSGFQYQVIKTGTGKKPKADDFVLLSATQENREGKKMVIADPDSGQDPVPIAQMTEFSDIISLMPEGTSFRIWGDMSKTAEKQKIDPSIDTLIRIDMKLERVISKEEYKQTKMMQQMQQQQMQEMMKQQKGGR